MRGSVSEVFSTATKGLRTPSNARHLFAWQQRWRLGDVKCQATARAQAAQTLKSTANFMAVKPSSNARKVALVLNLNKSVAISNCETRL